MSLEFPVHLGDVHSELSSLLYAVQTEFKGTTVEIRYDQYTYLNVEIEVWGIVNPARKIDEIVLKLQQGILHDEYDYRFRGISHPPLESLEPWQSYKVTASVDLGHWPHRRARGFDGCRDAVEWPLSAAGQPLAPPAPAN